MLIVFLGSEYQSIRPILPEVKIDKPHAVIIAQHGVYQLNNVLRELHDRHDIFIHVLKRDLQVAGLLANFTEHDRVNIIGFEEFVRLSTQHSPCITLQ
jgi:sulfur transfer complex TusBCD TusB component (DsrH family)